MMAQPLKRIKVSEGKDQENTDRISSLPDELLGYILSYLPTKCAVGTSILSSRWRCPHMFTSCLSFSVPYEFSKELEKDQTRRFVRFVNRVLLLHKVSPIKKFSLHCGRYIYDDLDVHTWISSVISKGVEQLHLSFYHQSIGLPHCLFSYQKIVELKLSFIDDLQVPESIYLPNLKTLHLRGIRFSRTDSFRKLLSACSVLQELDVAICVWPPWDTYNRVCLSLISLKRLTLYYCEDHFEVDAPNLVYLHYVVNDVHVGLSLKNADHLVTAILELYFTDSNNSIQLTALALVKAVYHVEELQLLGEALEGLISYTFREKDWPLNKDLVPFSSSVKVIEAASFRGYKSELALVKYLLANAEVLQRLALYRDRDELSTQQELHACNELLTFSRASPTCAVLLRD